VETIVLAIAGGGLIGLAAAMMLLFNGRIAGISGVANGLLAPRAGDWPWRAAFLAGLVAGGGVMAQLMPAAFAADTGRPLAVVAAAGLLVGFGSVLANGCTSGHGVCGVSRLSPRSIAATGIFIAAGMATVALLRLAGAVP
jgi:uncharacterized membrane protein YedE/YeeE